MDERHREVEPPLHAAGVAAHLAVGRLREPDPLKQLVRAGLARLARQGLERRLQAQVLASRQQRVERRLLQRRADRGPHLRPLVDDVVAGDARRSRGGRQQGRQHVHGRGLAGPVRAEEPVDLTRSDGQVDPVDRPRPLLEHPNQTVRFDRVPVHRPVP